ncbi:MAG: ABC transporter permease, partial [Verrucomicrobiales bacterium]
MMNESGKKRRLLYEPEFAILAGHHPGFLFQRMTFWREILEGLRISIDSVIANKLRSSLTTLGIVIGILTVTLMGTAIEGLNRAFRSSISALGSDVLYVQRRGWFIDSHLEWMKVMRRKEITWTQAEQLRKNMTLAKAVAPVVGNETAVKYNKKSSSNVRLMGSTEAFVVTAGLNVVEGRFFSSAESDGGRPVCVLGWGVATNLFGGESSLGKYVTMAGQRVEVVGVL